MGDNSVMYMKCPHCGASWYGNIKYSGNNCVVVEGLEDVDVTKKITCLACHQEYVPIETSIKMWEFVARALRAVKGG